MNWIPALLLAIVIALSCAIGYVWADRNAAEKIAAANLSTSTCTDASAAQQLALETVTDRLAQLHADHKALLASADAAVMHRDSEIALLTKQLESRTGNVRKAGKNDPLCTSLADVPVCPAIARELWPDAAQAGAEPADHD